MSVVSMPVQDFDGSKRLFDHPSVAEVTRDVLDVLIEDQREQERARRALALLIRYESLVEERSRLQSEVREYGEQGEMEKMFHAGRRLEQLGIIISAFTIQGIGNEL
jgi:hypothetical protein